MKRNFTLLFSILCVFLSHGQTPVSECAKSQSVVDSLIGTNNVELAAPEWDSLREKCKDLSEAFYVSGEKVLSYRHQIAAKTEKEAAAKNLIKLYDEYDKRFPANTNGNAINKAMLLHLSGSENRSDIYKLLDAAFEKTPAQFSNADAMHLYFDIYYDKFKSGDQGITAENILQKLDELRGHIARMNSKASAQQSHVYGNLDKSLMVKVKDAAVCENMIPYFTKKFETHKTDSLWLQNASSMLLDQNCTVDPIFATVTRAAHELSPTESSAYNMAIVSFRANDKSEAEKYFDQSASLSTDSHQKASIFYTIASTIYNTSNPAKAKEYAVKAVSAEPTFGKAYLFLAQLYGSSAGECTNDPFELKAINLLAAETALKAGVADPKYKVGADKVAENYRKKGPTQAEIKQAKMAGRTVSYKCWINESVAVPKN